MIKIKAIHDNGILTFSDTVGTGSNEKDRLQFSLLPNQILEISHQNILESYKFRELIHKGKIEIISRDTKDYDYVFFKDLEIIDDSIGSGGTIQDEITLGIRAADEGTVEGVPRGPHSVDLQTWRSCEHQVACGQYSTLSGGESNKSHGDFTVISGGSNNIALNDYSLVVGGCRNCAGGCASIINGGIKNTASGRYSIVSGGCQNTSSDYHSTIINGSQNISSSSHSLVGLGNNNTASGIHSIVLGGDNNAASGCHSTTINGLHNITSGSYSTVINGNNNTASGYHSTTINGLHNTTSGSYSTASGSYNTASGCFSYAFGRRAKAIHHGSFVWGDLTNADIESTSENQVTFRANGGFRIVDGDINTNCAVCATTFYGDGSNLTGISGGGGGSGGTIQNEITLGIRAANEGTVEGNPRGNNSVDLQTGKGNANQIASGCFSVISGGSNNTANSSWSTVSGGHDNTASCNYNATVSGGGNNTAIGINSTVTGGFGNTSSGYSSVVSGQYNTASGSYSTVSGGYCNTASGNGSSVSGGVCNTASGRYSFAAGYRAKAIHHGSFVWGDSTNADIEATSENQVTFRANGGFRIVGLPTDSTGLPNGSLWVDTTDYNTLKYVIS